MLPLTNKLLLAPMVRTGTCPLRLLALWYGADWVVSPETVDKRLLRSRRQVNGGCLLGVACIAAVLVGPRSRR